MFCPFEDFRFNQISYIFFVKYCPFEFLVKLIRVFCHFLDLEKCQIQSNKSEFFIMFCPFEDFRFSQISYIFLLNFVPLKISDSVKLIRVFCNFLDLEKCQIQSN